MKKHPILRFTIATWSPELWHFAVIVASTVLFQLERIVDVRPVATDPNTRKRRLQAKQTVPSFAATTSWWLEDPLEEHDPHTQAPGRKGVRYDSELRIKSAKWSKVLS